MWIKNLPKWRRAEAGLNKTNVEDNPNSINNNVTLSEYFITNAENDPDAMSYSDQIRSRDIDRDVNSSTSGFLYMKLPKAILILWPSAG